MRKVSYPAKITYQKGDKNYLVEFPDLKGCLTEGKTLEDAQKQAKEALSGYLESVFERNFKLPEPSPLKGKNVYEIEPDLEVAVPIALRQARKEIKLTQKQAAKKLGITYQVYQRFENPRKCNITIKNLSKISERFGLPVHLCFG